MLTVYGSKLCPDCIELEKAFEAEQVQYEYHDITGDLRALKAFLAMRDRETLFQDVKEQGFIGIPVVQTEDGTLTFSWQDFVEKEGKGSSCSNGVCGIPSSKQ